MPNLRDAGRGAIVNISSTATFHGTWGNYGIVKAGVEALTRSLAVEGAPHGVRANSVSPGWIGTDAVNTGADKSWQKGVSLFGRSGRPDEIATAGAFLARGEASFITGPTLTLDAGPLLPAYPSFPPHVT